MIINFFQNNYRYLLYYLFLYLTIVPGISFANTADNIVNISAQFLNKPYAIDPLGEGINGTISQKPLVRFDRFDCQTYVETILALALSENKQQFLQQLLQIRYRNGKPDFFTRNHFPDADWIPQNIQKKYIAYSPLNRDRISMIINKKQWFEDKTHLKNLHFPSRLKVTLPYISLAHLPSVIDAIPDGAIIMIVEPHFLLISHMGFAIRKNHQLYLRSSSSLYHKVIDLPLWPYLYEESRYGVKGIVVLVAQEKRQ